MLEVCSGPATEITQRKRAIRTLRGGGAGQGAGRKGGGGKQSDLDDNRLPDEL